MKKYFLPLAAAALLSGCESMPFEVYRREDRVALTQDQRLVQEQQRRLAGRLETIEMELGRLSRDLESLRAQLDSRCAAIERKSEADKREMVARLSGELDKLIKQASAAARPAPTPAPAAATVSRGMEHIVQPGETLYIIAKAYGVSTKTVMDANKITDPNRLSVGQRLVIPQ
jgi:hypothetical protein